MKRFKVTFGKNSRAKITQICLGKTKEELLSFMDQRYRLDIIEIEEVTEERVPVLDPSIKRGNITKGLTDLSSFTKYKTRIRN